MKAADFLNEFDTEQFPVPVGPWVSIFDHDPPFTMTELRQMARQGIIELDTQPLQPARYRLTLKAAHRRLTGGR